MTFRKACFVRCVALVLVSASPSWARNWSVISAPTPLFYPSLALINGSQPVVSTFTGVYQATALGWTRYNGAGGGFIAGDGGTKIVSNPYSSVYPSPVKYGLDGKFYSGYMGMATTLENGQWLATGATAAPYSEYTVSTADANGRIYAACGPSIAMSGGETLFPYINVWDLAVSAFGDIAVSGINAQNQWSVKWFDYRLGSWQERVLGDYVSGTQSKPAVAFDRQGNLGVGYIISKQMHFAYLDLDQDVWTDETIASVGTGNPYYYYWSDLAFDRQDLPVLLGGGILAYDPVTTPEPASVVLLALSAMWGLRRKMR